MTDAEAGATLERARSAAAAGEWREAFALFREADAAELLGVADLPLVADVAYAAGDVDVTIQT